MKTIKLLLTESIEGLGIVGDVVTVKAGYARNYLLPRGFATEPSEGNIQRLAERRAQVEQEMRQKRLDQEGLIEKLQDYELTLERSSNEQGVLYGGVSQHDIAEMLRGEGFAIEDRAVRVGEQISRLDSYSIPIQLATDLKTQIKLWVVSDKPMEQLQSEEESDSAEQGAGQDQQAAPSGAGESSE